MNEKYKLFFGQTYYASGGYNDFEGIFDSIEGAKKFIENKYQEEYDAWAHIVLENRIVCTGKMDRCLNDMAIWTWK